MKHQKEWYTCDRCNAEIDRLPQDKNWITRAITSPAKLTEIYETSTGYISDKYKVAEKILVVEIIESTNRREKTFHLCPKCRKDFERFMRNGEH